MQDDIPTKSHHEPNDGEPRTSFHPSLWSPCPKRSQAAQMAEHVVISFQSSQPSFEAMWVLAKKRFKSQSLHETPTAKQTEISKAVRLSQQIYPVIFKAYKTRMLPKREERLPLQKSDLFTPLLPISPTLSFSSSLARTPKALFRKKKSVEPLGMKFGQVRCCNFQSEHLPSSNSAAWVFAKRWGSSCWDFVALP